VEWVCDDRPLVPTAQTVLSLPNIGGAGT